MRLSSEIASEGSAGGMRNSVDEAKEAREARKSGQKSGQSLFEPNLYKRHLEEARAWVEACRRAGKRPEQILDACGERGDLHFLLMSERARFALSVCIKESLRL